MLPFLAKSTRVLLFTGKGGVGKTTLACASAVQLAEQGQRVLLVSTDPASNLDDVLGEVLSNCPACVPGAPNLSAMNLNPEVAAREYRERMVGPYRGVLPEAAIRSMEEQFSGSCTVEIAAFDEFSRLLSDPQVTDAFDHIVFDTAPTGHTLRLLTLPSAWSGFMQSNTTGTSCLGPLAGLQAQQQLYRQAASALQDAQLTTLLLVARPDRSALLEAARTSQELQQLGVLNQHLIINGLVGERRDGDPVARAWRDRERQAMTELPESLQGLNRTTVALAGGSLLGIEALRHFGSSQPIDEVWSESIEDCPDASRELTAGLRRLVDELSTMGRGVVLTMGKGGVGKTTVAAALAVSLAERGCEVLLSTTDPADHLAQTLGHCELPTLSVSRIDPIHETEAYTQEVLQTAGAQLDADGQAVLLEDLRSPCTAEIAVFRAFARTVAEGTDRIVVLDTAPTGHTILLMDAALAYHREVTRQASELPESVAQLLPRLRDPDLTRVLIVTLPEQTPVLEATRLQDDLRRAGIEPFAWVINQSLLPLEIQDPLLARRREAERPFVDEVLNSLAARAVVIGWQSDSPTGIDALRQLVGKLGVTADTQDN